MVGVARLQERGLPAAPGFPGSSRSNILRVVVLHPGNTPTGRKKKTSNMWMGRAGGNLKQLDGNKVETKGPPLGRQIQHVYSWWEHLGWLLDVHPLPPQKQTGSPRTSDIGQSRTLIHQADECGVDLSPWGQSKEVVEANGAGPLLLLDDGFSLPHRPVSSIFPPGLSNQD